MKGRTYNTSDEQAIRELCKDLDEKLLSIREDVLERASGILGYQLSVQSFHGKIGGKNDIFANVANERFPNSEYFIRVWSSGMLRKYKESEKYNCGTAIWELVNLYKDSVCREYIFLFLQRNFFRHYIERVRQKPDEELFRVWFGGKLSLGLLIAPRRCPDGRWRIDHSEIRRASYQYWTIGHILSVGGFLNPETDELYPVRNLDDIETFYGHIVKSLSDSIYEKQFCSLYIEYLKQSENPLSEPFLIPEMHYEGYGRSCRYRLDFTVLNPYTFEFTGFELSPSSSHIHVEKAKGKTQAQMNQDLKEQWQREASKRKAYFRKFGINVITFADDDLEDIEDCFDVVRHYLKRRNVSVPQLSSIIGEIDRL